MKATDVKDRPVVWALIVDVLQAKLKKSDKKLYISFHSPVTCMETDRRAVKFSRSQILSAVVLSYLGWLR